VYSKYIKFKYFNINKHKIILILSCRFTVSVAEQVNYFDFHPVNILKLSKWVMSLGGHTAANKACQ
jgi:hypothetical protein